MCHILPEGDAFVGAWDVANKVSDLLMVRLDRELCSCAGDLSKYKEISTKQVVMESSSSQVEEGGLLKPLKVDIFSMNDVTANSEVAVLENYEGEKEDMKGMGLTTPLRISSKQKGSYVDSVQYMHSILENCEHLYRSGQQLSSGS